MGNMSRCVDMRKLMVFEMKSHECRVFMQWILSVIFGELIPQGVRKAEAVRAVNESSEAE